MNDLVLELECSEPLYLQLFATLRDRILDGEIRPGTRLPATRALAEHLGVSRSVVVAGYKLLTEEGYTYAHVGSGTFVRSQQREHATSPEIESRRDQGTGQQAEPRVSRLVRRLLEIDLDEDVDRFASAETEPIDFGLTGLPERKRSTADRNEPHGILRAERQATGPEPFGLPALREAIASLVRRARDIRCRAEQVVVVPDSQYAYELVARALADVGSSVLIEDPNHPQVRMTFESIGADLVPCPIDEAGFDIDAALEGESAPSLICVAPTDQFPSGSTMGLEARRRLLDQSRAADAMILEDTLDTALEPIATVAPWLGSLDREGRVIHLATMAHVPTPDLRLSFIVLPQTLIEPVQQLTRLSRHAARTDAQQTLARLIANGLYERLARRAQRRQARLRASLTEEAQRFFDDEEIRLSGGVAAPRITVQLPHLTVDDEARLARYARDQHVAVTRLSTFYVTAPPRTGLILGYGELSEPGIREGVRRLHHAWRALQRDGATIDR